MKARRSRIKDVRVEEFLTSLSVELPPFFALTSIEKVDLSDVGDPFARFVAFELIRALSEPTVIKDPLLAVRQARVGGMYVAPASLVKVPVGLQVSKEPIARALLLVMLREQQKGALVASKVKEPAANGRLGGNSRRRATYLRRLEAAGLTEKDIVHMRLLRQSTGSTAAALEVLEVEYPWMRRGTLAGIASGDAFAQVGV